MAKLNFQLLFVCFASWAIIHVSLSFVLTILLQLFSPSKAQAVQSLIPPRKANLRRLLRSLVYCLFASYNGIYLMSQTKSWPQDLLVFWDPTMEFVFTVCLSHWLFSIVEDNYAQGYLAPRLPSQAFDAAKEGYMFTGLISHHLLASLVFLWILVNQNLTGLGVMGLYFELPVIFLTFRELMICFDDIFHLASKLPLQYLWNFTILAWHLTRTSSSGIYVYSLTFWRSDLARLLPDSTSYFMYHLFGLMFTFVNFEVLFKVVVRSMVDDAKNFMGLAFKKVVSQDLEVGYTMVPLSDPQHPPSFQSMEMDRLLPLNNDTNPKTCPFSKNTSSPLTPHLDTDNNNKNNNLRLIGPKELATHHTEEDCWVQIQDKIYDLTSFLNAHPGGKSIILQVAGKDGSEEFQEAGHSMKAHGMMKKYHIANLLPHGYDQQGLDQPHSLEKKELMKKLDVMQLDGDPSLPYLAYKSYFNASDPIVLMIVTAFCYPWMLKDLGNELLLLIHSSASMLTSSSSISLLSPSSSPVILHDTLMNTLYSALPLVSRTLSLSLLFPILLVIFVLTSPPPPPSSSLSSSSNYAPNTMKDCCSYWANVLLPLLTRGLSHFPSLLAGVLLVLSLSCDVSLLSLGPKYRYSISTFRGTDLTTSSSTTSSSSSSPSIGVYYLLRVSLLLTIGFEFLFHNLYCLFFSDGNHLPTHILSSSSSSSSSSFSSSKKHEENNNNNNKHEKYDEREKSQSSEYDSNTSLLHSDDDEQDNDERPYLSPSASPLCPSFNQLFSIPFLLTKLLNPFYLCKSFVRGILSERYRIGMLIILAAFIDLWTCSLLNSPYSSSSSSPLTSKLDASSSSSSWNIQFVIHSLFFFIRSLLSMCQQPMIQFLIFSSLIRYFFFRSLQHTLYRLSSDYLAVAIYLVLIGSIFSFFFCLIGGGNGLPSFSSYLVSPSFSFDSISSSSSSSLQKLFQEKNFLSSSFYHQQQQQQSSSSSTSSSFPIIYTLSYSHFHLLYLICSQSFLFVCQFVVLVYLIHWIGLGPAPNNTNNNKSSSSSSDSSSSSSSVSSLSTQPIPSSLAISPRSPLTFPSITSSSLYSSLLLLMFLWSESSPLGLGRWIVFILIFTAILDLSALTQRLLYLPSSHPLHPAPYVYALKSFENTIRLYSTMGVYFTIVNNLVRFLSSLAPDGQMYWCAPSVVAEIKGCDYGMAYMMTPPVDEQPPPTLFQCNVGYMGMDGPDLIETVGSTKRMLEEIGADPDAGKKGFAADLVAIFVLDPSKQKKTSSSSTSSASSSSSPYMIREVNLSAWRDEKAAYEWYKTSEAHKEIVQKHYNAGLKDFSAMLGRLKAPESSPLRWEIRCSCCRRMVTGPHPTQCPYCSSPMSPMPYV